MSFKPIIHRYEATVADFFVNAFLIETQNSVVAIDATIAVSSARELRKMIDKDIKKPLKAVLMTHGHPDHFTGLSELTKGLDVPVYATQGVIDFAKEEDERKAPTAVHIFGDDYPKVRMFPNTLVVDKDIVTIDGIDFQIFDYGPGESDDDTLWVFKIDDTKHVFLGDLIHNHMHCFFRDIHALEWLKSLDRLISEFDHTAVLYTSHGLPCGTEIAYWHKAYIEAFIGSLKSMLGNRDYLTEDEKAKLVSRMQSFLPNDKTLFLLTYELDETIKLFREKGIIPQLQYR